MKTKLFIIKLFLSFTALGQSVTIIPDAQSTSNHAQEFYSGSSQYVLHLRNNNIFATGLSFKNYSGLGRGSLFATDNDFSIVHPLGDVVLRNNYTPNQLVKLHANGNFAVGDIVTPSAGLHVKDFTKLGEDAPAVKMKKFTGTTPAFQGSCVTIPLGSISAEKVLDYKVFVSYGTILSNVVSEEYSLNPNYKFSTFLESSDISICLHTGNSSLITNKSFKVLITYEE